MIAEIWDIKKHQWLYIKNVKRIVTLSTNTFKLDGKEYKTTDFDLNFILSEG